MRGNTLLGNLLFAAVAAAGLVPFMMLAYPFVGPGNAATGYHFVVVASYLIWIAPRLASGLRAGLVALALLTLVGIVTPSYPAAMLGASVVLAVVRSGLLYRSRPARALLIESMLIGGGLLFGGILAGGTPIRMAASLWGFYLVQSLFFVIGGVAARPSRAPEGDPFESARARAMAAMEEPVG